MSESARLLLCVGLIVVAGGAALAAPPPREPLRPGILLRQLPSGEVLLLDPQVMRLSRWAGGCPRRWPPSAPPPAPPTPSPGTPRASGWRCCARSAGGRWWKVIGYAGGWAATRSCTGCTLDVSPAPCARRPWRSPGPWSLPGRSCTPPGWRARRGRAPAFTLTPTGGGRSTWLYPTRFGGAWRSPRVTGRRCGRWSRSLSGGTFWPTAPGGTRCSRTQ
jgi:hypothetical protein